MTFANNGTSVTFSGIIYPVPYSSRGLQSWGTSKDGTVRVYDGDLNEEFISLLIKDDHSNLADIRSFIQVTAVYRKNTFTFTPDAGHNVGNGDGGAITVRYWEDRFTETQYIYQLYRYEYLLRKEIT